MTLHWDEKYGMLEQEKQHAGKLKDLERFPSRCCGNSPGKERVKDSYDLLPREIAERRSISRSRQSSPTTVCLRKAKKQRVKSANANKVMAKKARILKKSITTDKKSKQKYLAYQGRGTQSAFGKRKKSGAPTRNVAQ